MLTFLLTPKEQCWQGQHDRCTQDRIFSVLMLLYMCPHDALYVSSWCYICVLILLYIFLCTCLSYCHICVLMLLYMCLLNYYNVLHEPYQRATLSALHHVWGPHGSHGTAGWSRRSALESLGESSPNCEFFTFGNLNVALWLLLYI
jgi:hypothetical protein